MAYLSGVLALGKWTEARSVSGVIAADSATLTDANFPTTLGLDCSGYETVIVAATIAAGTNPTITVEALVRDPDAADGQRWVRRTSAGSGLTSGALLTGHCAELSVDASSLVLFRISAVTNSGSTTSCKVLVTPGKRSRPRPQHT